MRVVISKHVGRPDFLRGCHRRCQQTCLLGSLGRWTREFRVDGIPHIAFVLPDRCAVLPDIGLAYGGSSNMF